jgi:hypothetical protein
MTKGKLTKSCCVQAKASMFLNHLVDRLTKFIGSTLLPDIKQLATTYTKKHKSADYKEVLTSLLQEVPMYREILLPNDESQTVLDEYVKKAFARIPDLDSMVEHTLQFRSMLISADQGNTVNINLNIPSTRDFLYTTLVNVAEEFVDDPEGSWLTAKQQEVRSTIASAVRQTIDSYLPYIRKQLESSLPETQDDSAAQDEAEEDGEEEGDNAEAGAEQSRVIKVDKTAAKKQPNPEIKSDDDEFKDGGDDMDDEDDDDDF